VKYFIAVLLVTFSLYGQTNFILIGPPGAGKGTFSSFMKNQYGYYQICPGDILRQHIKDNTELGQEIQPIVERGDYIDDSIVFRIIDEQVSYCLEHEIPFIIDGFPRGIASIEFLRQLLKVKNIESTITFVHFQVDDETCIERIDQRLVCFNCSHVFNMTTRRPKKSMTCDECDTSLEIRLGDTVANTTKRLAYYRKNIEPLVALVHDEYPVLVINAQSELTDCLEVYKQLAV
jgi:adenylate kinase